MLLGEAVRRDPKCLGHAIMPDPRAWLPNSIQARIKMFEFGSHACLFCLDFDHCGDRKLKLILF